MEHNEVLQDFIQSPAFRQALGIRPDAVLSPELLGNGEYNINYRLCHPESGQWLVLRRNTGSQLHLDDQIGYEFEALRALAPSGRTPRPLYCDRERGMLVMEYLPGRALRYETDLDDAAAILADIHATPVPGDCPLLRPSCPAAAIYEECLAMAEQYLTWEGAEKGVCRLLEVLIAEIGRLPLKTAASAPACMVNTEVNSGNFLINPGARSYLVDWEKPLLSEPAQDLGHFLVPTTTFWKTDVILKPEEIAAFTAAYGKAAAGRLDLRELPQRLPLFFTVTCLRGVSWCAMAMREYSQPGRALCNADTFRKIQDYLREDFLENILHNYVRKNFLEGLQL